MHAPSDKCTMGERKKRGRKEGDVGHGFHEGREGAAHGMSPYPFVPLVGATDDYRLLLDAVGMSKSFMWGFGYCIGSNRWFVS